MLARLATVLWQTATPALGPGERRVGQVRVNASVRPARLMASPLLPRLDNWQDISMLEGGRTMKKVLGAVLALLLGLSTAGAWAAEVSGKIKSVDPGQRAIVLEDDSIIWIAEGLPMDNLQEGKSVKASYEEREGKKVATSVEVTE